MISCPSCGREQRGEGEQCYYCSADLLPAGPGQQIRFGPHLKVGKKFKIGMDLIAKAKKDGAVHVRQNPTADWKPVLLLGVLAVAGVFLPDYLEPAWLRGLLVGLPPVTVAYLAERHIRWWTLRRGYLEVRKYAIGKTRVVLFESGYLALRAVEPDGLTSKVREELVIVHGGKSHTVCRSLGIHSLRTLGHIIACETGFLFDDPYLEESTNHR